MTDDDATTQTAPTMVRLEAIWKSSGDGAKDLLIGDEAMRALFRQLKALGADQPTIHLHGDQ